MLDGGGEMRQQDLKPNQWLYGVAVLVILFGTLISALLFKNSGVTTYLTMIADAYCEEQHHLNVPGSVDIKLTRTGAYGIYYEFSLVSSIYPDEGMPSARVFSQLACYPICAFKIM
jgi:hypothetical protein